MKQWLVLPAIWRLQTRPGRKEATEAEPLHAWPADTFISHSWPNLRLRLRLACSSLAIQRHSLRSGHAGQPHVLLAVGLACPVARMR